MTGILKWIWKSVRMKKTKVLGHFDGVQGNVAYGWAYKPSSAEKKIRVQILAGTRVVGEGFASKFREDLAEANIGDGNCSFSIPIELQENEQLVLRAKIADDDVYLNNSISMSTVAMPAEVEHVSISEIKVGEDPRHGTIETLIHTYDLQALNAVSRAFVSYHILKFSSILGTIELLGIFDGVVYLRFNGLNLEEREVNLIIDESHRLAIALDHQDSSKSSLMGSVHLPSELQDGQSHLFCFEFHINGELSRSDFRVVRYPVYTSYIDSFDGRELSGWVVRRDSVLPVKVELWRHNTKIDTCTADLARVDVMESLGLNSATCGFRFVLGSPLLLGMDVFELRDAGTGLKICRIQGGWEVDDAIRQASILRESKYEQSIFLLAYASRNMPQNNFNYRVQYQPPQEQVSNDTVSVIVPVYEGLEETKHCIESVLRAKSRRKLNLIVVDDASPNKEIGRFLDALDRSRREGVSVVRRKENGGFSEAVNFGIVLAGRSDVILLNSDTVVFDYWADRLSSAASLSDAIGTVTPLSNNAEIATYPYPCRVLDVKDLSVAKFLDEQASIVNADTIVDTPVAIGFCMFIKRQCIDEIGLFDSAVWGRGYGEEVDFCLKASFSGWRHVIATDTFVVHRGNISFGNEKYERIIRSAEKISEMYPFYNGMIQRYIQADPLRSCRRRISFEVMRHYRDGACVLHVVHNLGGGTERFVGDFIAAERSVSQQAILKVGIDGNAVLQVDIDGPAFKDLYDLPHLEHFGRSEEQSLKDACIALRPSQVYIHSPLGLSASFLKWLKESFDYVVVAHDYAWVCPRVSMNQIKGRYCGEPDVSECEKCIQRFGVHPGVRTLFDSVEGTVVAYRSFLTDIVHDAKIVRAGSRDAARRLEKYAPGANFSVEAYPPAANPAMDQRIDLSGTLGQDEHLVVAMIGGISEIKGFHVLNECAKVTRSLGIPIRYVVIGHTCDDKALQSHDNVIITGRYEEDELERLVRACKPHISFFPSQCPETFSYTLSHAFRLNLWPVASDIGAIAERIKESGFGTTYRPDLAIEQIVELLFDVGSRRERRGEIDGPC